MSKRAGLLIPFGTYPGRLISAKFRLYDTIWGCLSGIGSPYLAPIICRYLLYVTPGPCYDLTPSLSGHVGCFQAAYPASKRTRFEI